MVEEESWFPTVTGDYDSPLKFLMDVHFGWTIRVSV